MLIKKGNVIHWSYAAVESNLLQSTNKCDTVFIWETNGWYDTVQAIYKHHTIPRKSFSFPGSITKWELVGVILLNTYAVIVPFIYSKKNIF